MKKMFDAVNKFEKLILDTERYIWQNPETGFKEVKTSKYMQEVFENLGYDLVMAGNIPGFYTVVDTGRPGPTVLILAELDSVICPQHPQCDKETGAVHACGHNAQCAALVGIAAALKEKGVTDELCGKIKLCAVPAEELLEIDYRSSLKEQGIIKYFGGKTEFLYRGFFDDVDLAFMVHTGARISVMDGYVGCIAKTVTYKGKAAHAGGSPWDGVNALYAATNGINAVNAIRETFQEKDIIRVHPIITEGGTIVNAIPEKVTIESHVRGTTFEGMEKANKKVNRALIGAALSIGANIEINDISGYSPLTTCKKLIDVTREAAQVAMPDEPFNYIPMIGSGCSDFGDLSCIMPVVHPYVPGCKGNCHGDDFYITNPENACIGSAKLQLAMLDILLSNGAERAEKIVSEYTPVFETKDKYIEFVDKITSCGERIEYIDDENVKISL